MAQVPEKVLAWLYSVLHEYQDPQRTYFDAARTLSAQPSLSPRTEVYTYDNGRPALLLTIAGTLPVDFRGTLYRFPIKLWIPQAYPQEAPMVYVTPGRDMNIRPGQHVGVDGRVYHPYLADWVRMWNRTSLVEFLGLLQQVFAKEPPVISKAQQQQFQRQIGQPSPASHATPGASSMPPILPPKQRVGSTGPSELSSTITPPPRPPKPGEEYASPALPVRTSSRNVTKDGPPLPPLPHERPASQYAQSDTHHNGRAVPPVSQYQLTHGMQAPGYQNGKAAGSPLPAQLAQQRQPQYQHRRDPSPVSPVSPVACLSELHAYTAPMPPQACQPQMQQPPAAPYQQNQPAAWQLSHQQQQQQRSFPANQSYDPQQVPAQQSKKAPPPDLLSSDPFDVTLPGANAGSSNMPAPPIPPNPEKEHLLQALSSTLVQQAQAKINQNLAALAPLQAQQAALLAAHQRLEAEMQQLQHLSRALDSNEAILRRSIAECDNTIATSKSKALPNVDEVLVPTSVVANQLWTLCAEEAGVREAMYVLQKAVDRGRVSGESFVRAMRALGREAFTKTVLARKCAAGLGLEVQGVGRGYEG
ncbi:UEV-domain-containing protein [Teratosphaeria nubilosa]|uniref:UEV-domain-containing protein n=1 Tax=Teratosphaeria nubilosa TaxID=161662 RepID=A0A6G1LN73_9PEZI|nr:UEV-domain-containing protein [Teratosphaeria nubilosa]